MQVKAYEQKWAVSKCGAIAIIPKLSQTKLNDTIALIVDTLDGNLEIDALERVSVLMVDIYTENLEAEIAKIKNQLANVPPPSPKVTAISSDRGSNLETHLTPNEEEDISLSETRIQPSIESVIAAKPKVTTYRGVKVKKLQW